MEWLGLLGSHHLATAFLQPLQVHCRQRLWWFRFATALAVRRSRCLCRTVWQKYEKWLLAKASLHHYAKSEVPCEHARMLRAKNTYSTELPKELWKHTVRDRFI